MIAGRSLNAREAGCFEKLDGSKRKWEHYTMNKRSTAATVKTVFARSRYVVLKSMMDGSIVAHGNDLSTVLRKANKAGVPEPFVLFPHDPAKRYIY